MALIQTDQKDPLRGSF